MEQEKKIYRVSQEVTKEAHENFENTAKKLGVKKSLLLESILVTLTSDAAKAVIDAATPKMTSARQNNRKAMLNRLKEMSTEEIAKLMEQLEQTS